MILQRLSIELETYGPRKGSYHVTIIVAENENKIELVLPPELGAAMVAQAKDLIHKFSVRAADQLHQELQLAAPELGVAKQLEDYSQAQTARPVKHAPL